jgi:hypothetical protein
MSQYNSRLMICERKAHIKSETAKFTQAIIQTSLACSRFEEADMLTVEYIVRVTANAKCRTVMAIRVVFLNIKIVYLTSYSNDQAP